MKFSAVVPTYNRLETLKKCLAALLSQDYPLEELQIIVVDDGSSDGTREYLKATSDPNLIFYLNDHGGPAKARNFGAGKSQGLYLAFTDDDCLVPNNWLKELEKGFNKWPQAAGVGGYLEAPAPVLENNSLAKLEYYETHTVYHASPEEYLGGFESPSGGTNNIAYRREIFEKLGGFDENIPVPAGEDADLKLRAVEAGYKIGYLPLKVTHLDPYTLKTFIERSICSGIGSAYFEKKHLQKKGNITTLIFMMAKAVFKSLLILFLSRRAGVPWLAHVKEFFINYGKILFLFK